MTAPIAEQLAGIGRDAGKRLADEFIKANRIGGPAVVAILQRRIADVRQLLAPHLPPAAVDREAQEMETAFWARIEHVAAAVTQNPNGGTA